MFEELPSEIPINKRRERCDESSIMNYGTHRYEPQPEKQRLLNNKAYGPRKQTQLDDSVYKVNFKACEEEEVEDKILTDEKILEESNRQLNLSISQFQIFFTKQKTKRVDKMMQFFNYIQKQFDASENFSNEIQFHDVSQGILPKLLSDSVVQFTQENEKEAIYNLETSVMDVKFKISIFIKRTIQLIGILLEGMKYSNQWGILEDNKVRIIRSVRQFRQSQRIFKAKNNRQ